MTNRVATIDIGTNTVLLLVAEARDDGELVAVEEHATITRLGEGVDRTRELRKEAIERTTTCLDAYASVVHRLGATRIAVVATSAMRDARGGDVIAAYVRDRFGVDLRIIGGDEEARLTFEGSLTGLPRPRGAVTVFDIGGGSTEVVVGSLEAGEGDARGGSFASLRMTAEVSYAHSFDVGSVRMTERHITSDPPSRAELDAIRRELATTFASVPPLPEGNAPVGIAGTVTTLAAVSMKLATYDSSRVHGYVLAREELRRVVDELASLPLATRRTVPGLEPKRADVIVAGGLVALALLDRWNAETVVISDRGVRWGLAVALNRTTATL
jgi:exopolyphosphatase/guanosine-5'-triphosphate,3'-diphosphate pyrophosphatase